MDPIKKVDKIRIRYVHNLHSDQNKDQNCFIQKYTFCAQINPLPNC